MPDPTVDAARERVIDLLRWTDDTPAVDALIGIVRREHQTDEAKARSAAYDKGWTDCHATMTRIWRELSTRNDRCPDS